MRLVVHDSGSPAQVDSMSDTFTRNGLRPPLAKWPSPGREGAPEPNAATPAPGTTSTATADPIDAGRLKVLRQLGPQAISRLACLFLDSTAGDVEQIRASAANSNRTALLAAVHSLKGSSATLGAFGLQAFCARIEARAKSGSDVARNLIEATDEEYARVRTALLELLDAASGLS